MSHDDFDVDRHANDSDPDGEDGGKRVMAAWKERCPIYLSLIKPMAVRVDFDVENA